MAIKWIKHNKDKIDRGDTNTPVDGDTYFVDEAGSKAIVNGILYIDGVKAPKGKHQIMDLDIDVDTKGNATRKKVAK